MTGTDLSTGGAKLQFPNNFLIGAATSAHQTEGNNVNSDWWDFERRSGTPVAEPSGDACDSYHRYRQDIQLAADLGLRAYRFSVEWARLEPAEGDFSAAQVAHYRRMLSSCHELGITPIVTLQHFTLPRWLGAEGGFLSPRFPSLFQRYCAHVAEAFGDLMAWACTINEPEFAGTTGWVHGSHPPGIKGDTESMRRVDDNVFEAHRLAVTAIHDHSSAAVGIPLALQDMHYEDAAVPGHSAWEHMTSVAERFLKASDDDDFIALQTYSRIRFGPEGQRGPGMQAPRERHVETPTSTQVGWEFYPRAVAGTIRRAANATRGKPILMTENGIATLDDTKRVAFIDGALRAIHECLSEAIDIRGYLYWSLLDNFEWAAGFTPRFGLVAVDRESFDRRPKPSARFLGAIARQHGLPAAPVPWPPAARFPSPLPS